jgi:hypothetical protein
MSAAYFWPLVLLPAVITRPGRYRTRRGEAVTVERMPRPFASHAFDCIGRYDSGVIEQWHRSGRLYAGALSANDVIAGPINV